MNPWKTLERRYVLSNQWQKVREDRIRLPDGSEIDDYCVVEYPDWVGVVCLTEAGALVLVEQYRHGIERVTLEVPAGTIDEGEDPLTAAKRELLEETGYTAETWTLLGCCAPNPGKETSYAHLYVAHGARPARAQRLDSSEFVTVHLLDPAEALRLIDADAFVHGIHVAALFWAHHRGLLVDERR